MLLQQIRVKLVVAVAISCFHMSGIVKTPVLAVEVGNQNRKRSLPPSEQSCKKTKSDVMSANEKKSNFSLINLSSNGAIKSSSSAMNKPGAATKKLIIKNFKSMFTSSKPCRHNL